MPKPKKKTGLHKDFSKIFDGVWVPPKPGSESASPQPATQDRDKPQAGPKADKPPRAAEAPAREDWGRTVEPPTLREEPVIRAPLPHEQGQVSDGGRPDEQAGVAESPAHGEPQRAEGAEAFREHDPQINEIISSMKCPKGFVCYKSGFKRLCKVKSVGEGKIIECSPENQGPCVYRFSFTGKLFCKCPLRYYIVRHLHM